MNTKTKQHEPSPNGTGGEEPKGAKIGEPESPPDGSTPSIKQIRNWDFGFLPIPKSRRHDPNLKPHEQFIFTWKINLVLAGAAVSLWWGDANGRRFLSQTSTTVKYVSNFPVEADV